MTKEVTKNKNSSCPKCGCSNIKVTTTEYEFPYGRGDDAVELKVNVPLITCSNCGLSVLDKNAQAIMHEAVCKHLGVMTPEEIRNIRESKDLSQAEFCRITKLGEATISRWERGVSIQNAAYDNYMFLLELPLNFERILKRNLEVEELDKTKEENEVSLTRTFPIGSPSFCKLAKM
ncbi:MAG: type II TA system antitoxin MqsA family protein [Phycisphaerae bacterium]